MSNTDQERIIKYATRIIGKHTSTLPALPSLMESMNHDSTLESVGRIQDPDLIEAKAAEKTWEDSLDNEHALKMNQPSAKKEKLLKDRVNRMA